MSDPIPPLRPLLLALLLAPLGAAQEPASGPPGPNVLFVTLEAARADHLGCYGRAEARTPRMDALAAAGARFEHAYAHAPLTLPAHASLMTGTTPLGHGVHEDGRTALGADLPTLAELFRDRGYRTAGFVGTIELSSEFGLTRGFELYDDDLGPPDDLKALKRVRPAKELMRAAIPWLVSESEAPFFCWIQLADARKPHAPPPDLRGLATPYDGELASVDRQLGHLLDALGEAQRLENTLIVIVGGEGESLGEQGESAHGALIHEAAVRVPLIVHMPGRVANGRVAARPVGQADLSPTVLELLGWERPALPETLAPFAGTSFADALRDGPPADVAGPPVYLETEYGARLFGWSTLRGLVVFSDAGGESAPALLKYVHGPRPQLFDLAADPGESANLAQDEPELVAELSRTLAGLLERSRGLAQGNRALDTRLTEQLAGVAYAQPRGASDGALAEGTGVDPAERIAAVEGYRAALAGCYTGNYIAMVAPLEQAVAASPDTPVLLTLLGVAYNRTRKFERALATFEEVLALEPDQILANYYAARTQISLGRPDAADAHYQLVVELDPDAYRAHLALGNRLGGQQRFEEALPHFRALVRLRPEERYLWVNFLHVLRSTSSWAELAPVLAEAVQAHPEDLYLLNYRAWVLATAPDPELRDCDLAVEIAAALAERTGRDDPGVLDTYAAALACAGRFEEAETIAALGVRLAHQRNLRQLLEPLRARLELYRNQTPYFETSD